MLDEISISSQASDVSQFQQTFPSDEEDNQQLNATPTPKRTRGPNKVYHLDETYNTLGEAEQILASEQIWSKKDSLKKSIDGLKQFYRCNIRCLLLSS
jgi:hypothetical protein